MLDSPKSLGYAMIAAGVVMAAVWIAMSPTIALVLAIGVLLVAGFFLAR